MPYRVAEPRPFLTELDERVLARLLDGGADADTLFAYLRTRNWPSEEARSEAEQRDEAYQLELRVAGPRRYAFPRVFAVVGGGLVALSGVAAWSHAERSRTAPADPVAAELVGADPGLAEDQLLQAPAEPSVEPRDLDGCGPGGGTVESCTHACDARDAGACVELGQRLLAGKGAPADAVAGLTAATRGCDLGDGTGCLVAGRWYLELAPAAERDRVRAERLLEKGCKGSSSEACLAMAKLHPMRAEEFRERACVDDLDDCLPE